jgi:predicted transglutaminase-like cysteine proteinase
MNLFKSIRSAMFAFVIAAIVLPAVTVEAQAGSPMGYKLMCLKTPEQCKGGGSNKERLTTGEMATLKKVNSSVNRSIKPRHDRSGTDVWTVGASSGDCEDYALAKRAALIKAGFSPSALRLAYVKTRRGEDHAVLIVKSNKGDLVLDNLTSTIKPLSQSGLRLVSMAGANPKKWS